MNGDVPAQRHAGLGLSGCAGGTDGPARTARAQPWGPGAPAPAPQQRVLQHRGQAERTDGRTGIARVQAAAGGTGHGFAFSCPGTPQLYRAAALSAQKESLALYSLADKALSHTSEPETQQTPAAVQPGGSTGTGRPGSAVGIRRSERELRHAQRAPGAGPRHAALSCCLIDFSPKKVKMLEFSLEF